MHALCQKMIVKCDFGFDELFDYILPCIMGLLRRGGTVQLWFKLMPLAGLQWFRIFQLFLTWVSFLCWSCDVLTVASRRASGHRHAAAGEEQLCRRRSEELLQRHARSGSAAHLWAVHQQTHQGPAGGQIHLRSTSGLLWFIEVVP